MITQWNVLALLKQLTDIDSADEPQALQICLTALEQIKHRLRDGASEDDIRIASAAAGMAFYTLCIRRTVNGDDVTSFKAGDISIQKKAADTMSFAQKICSDALAAAAPLFKDDGFLFCKVDV
ncbi:MAG: hypothetical protein IJF40_02330 [Clostridia bacterium]|nr:hypothetical protein [Clostridia bacterium]